MPDIALPPDLMDELPAFTALRRDLHAHPELGFQETRTADIVAERLQRWGYEVHRGLGGTGVVGQLRAGRSSRSIGLRADMDALPIQEGNLFAHASRHAGCMHACGHDGHTAMLLLAARQLAARPDFDGVLNLIFQPAEEGLGGGRRMVEDGLFERFPCDAVFALHNVPGFALGQFGFRAGPFMASADTVTIVIHGKGGHGAMPEQTIDPIVAGAALVLALQTAVSRNIASTDSAVVTVGAFNAGQSPNVVPGEATLKLTVRTHDSAVRERVLQRIGEIARAQAQTFGATAEVVLTPVYPVLVNDATATDFARQVLLDWRGPTALIDALPMQSGAEDFAYLLQARPGCYFIVGNGVDAAPLHSAGYDFDDAVLPIGAAFWTRLVGAWLGKDKDGT